MAWIAGWHPGVAPETAGRTMLVWLGYINLMLAGFNMIPGFPLDGGRILRSIVWWTTKDSAKSTRIAAHMGQLVAVGFIALGILRFFAGKDLADSGSALSDSSFRRLRARVYYKPGSQPT